MRINYVLVDYENVPVNSLALLKDEHFRVRIFLGPNNSKLPTSMVLAVQKLGGRGSFVTMEKSGSNALDFHIAYYLGALAAAEPAAFYHIISKDTGFDPLIQHLKAERKISVVRSSAIEEMPCFQAPKGNGVAVENLLQKAIADLQKRQKARPRTTKTLMSTLHATCGKELPASTIEAVLKVLVEKRFVVVQGTKLTYSLPESAIADSPSAN